jgi:hypothetical protein
MGETVRVPVIIRLQRLSFIPSPILSIYGEMSEGQRGGRVRVGLKKQLKSSSFQMALMPHRGLGFRMRTSGVVTKLQSMEFV